MQRLFTFLLVVAVLAALGYWQRDLLLEYYHRYAPSGAPGAARPEPAPTYQPQPPGLPPTRVPPPLATGEKSFAPAGTFYVVKERKFTDATGIRLVRPGDLVKLIQRLPNGKVRVTVDKTDFILNSNDVTDDLDVAREAERKYLEAPPR